MDEDTAVATEQIAPPAETAGTRRSWRRPTPLMLLIAILVAAVLAQSVLIFRGNDSDRVRDEVRDTAGRFVAILTTYNSNTLESQRTRVLALATGQFRRQYAELTGASFLAALRETQADAKGTADRLAVLDVNGDDATVLAVVRITTTNKDLKTPRVDSQLLEVSLVRTTGGWKVDAVQILGKLAG
jgi:Mce-associated membrane protein